MTPEHEASRTLVKSTPELWAELSDPTSLARHLNDFGEIRITRLEPETAVAWEGERARGTVRLEPSGWGTRVILTASAHAEDAAESSHIDVPPSEPEPLPEPPPRTDPDPLPPAAGPSSYAATPPRRPGLFSRLLARLGPQPQPQPPTTTKRPEAFVREPVRDAPATPLPPPRPPEIAVTATRPPEAAQTSPVPDPAAVLTAALDSLGQAHHRPFSRA
jgi:hypothetical protein